MEWSFNNEKNEFTFQGQVYQVNSDNIRRIYSYNTSNDNNNNDITTTSTSDDDGNDLTRFTWLALGKCYFRLLLHQVLSLRVQHQTSYYGYYRFFLLDNVEVVNVEVFGKVIDLNQRYRKYFPVTSSDVGVKFTIDDGSSSIECVYFHRSVLPIPLKLGKFIRCFGHCDMNQGKIIFKVDSIMSQEEEDKDLPLYLWLDFKFLFQTLYLPYSNYLTSKQRNQHHDQQQHQHHQEQEQEEEDVDVEYQQIDWQSNNLHKSPKLISTIDKKRKIDTVINQDEKDKLDSLLFDNGNQESDEVEEIDDQEQVQYLKRKDDGKHTRDGKSHCKDTVNNNNNKKKQQYEQVEESDSLFSDRHSTARSRSFSDKSRRDNG